MDLHSEAAKRLQPLLILKAVNRSKTIGSPAHFGAFSRREHLATAIFRITGAPLLRLPANVGGPSIGSTGQTASPVVQCSSPALGNVPWCSRTAA